MAKLRLRRGANILGSTDEAGLAEWLSSGLISEFDLVAVGEDGEDWQLIRDYLANTGGAAAPTAPEPTLAPPPREPAKPAAPQPAKPKSEDDDYRPIWDVGDDEGEAEEAAEIRMPSFAEEPDDEPAPKSERPPAPKATPEPAPSRPAKKTAGRSSTQIPAARASSSDPELRSREAAVGDPSKLDDTEIDRLFSVIVKHEQTAPSVEDPNAKAPATAGRRKRPGKQPSGSIDTAKPRKKKRSSSGRSSVDIDARRKKKRRPSE